YLNSASRYLELSQATSQQGFTQLSQTSQVILQGQQSLEELRARERLLEKAAVLVHSPLSVVRGHLLEHEGLTKKDRGHDGRRLLPPRAAPGVRVESIVAAKCIRCHGPDRQSAGLRLDNLAALDARYEMKIIAKILADAPADRMPPPDAEKLTLAEKLTFLRA